MFQENADGSLEPTVQVNINGVVFGPGVRFTPGVAFGGVDMHKFKGLDLEADLIDNIWILRGFYPPNS
jgi:hypothetical protein